jgi:serine/threonine protein kinase/Flp pilus assembly protein TadD
MSAISDNAASEAPRAGSAIAAGQTQDDALVCSLADEMIRRWQAGDRVLAEELLDRQPELWDRAEQALQLIYEEICLRRQNGQDDGTGDVVRRFPQWRKQLQVMLECHRLLEQPASGPRFPQAGETLAGYSLLRELGRGGAGRVFLASQPALAHRPVVVKLIPRQGKEHLHLARLQHTHIVPLYSVQEDARSNLRILCMPYFGGTTLDQVLRALGPFPPGERSSAQLKAVLSTSGVEATGPARRIFNRLSYVQALCWIGVYLAEALHYAHDSGLVHLDLKPSNVLIAADGQPMLLDFHLARAPLEAGGTAADGLGGTPAYMPTEQQLALAAVARGAPIPLPVDRRADIYALGAVLYEALGGRLPFEPGVSRPLYLDNPQVTAGLSDILEKCLAPDARCRYAQAAEVAADLRRHLSDQLLVGVRNRSWAERWHKWQRRHPPVSRAWLWLAVLASGLAALSVGVVSHWNHLRSDALHALEEGQNNRRRQRFDEALVSLRGGLDFARTVPFQGVLVRELREEIHETELAQSAAQRAHLLDKLHALAEQVRGLYGMESVPAERLAALDRSCHDFWSQRQRIKSWLELSPTPQAAGDLLDLALFAADLKVRLARAADRNRARAEVIGDLNEAEKLFGSSVVLDYERARHQQALNQNISVSHPPPAARTVWEHCALGRSLLRDHDLPGATEHLRQALELQPRDFWTNFYYGICAHELGRHAEAVAAFSVCIGAAPGIAGSYFNRALAYTALGLDEPARRDYDQALRLDPHLAAAALNRGMLHHRARRFAQAEVDLQQALTLGADPATVFYDLAVVQLARQNAASARQSLQRALGYDPQHSQALRLWNNLR